MQPVAIVFCGYIINDVEIFRINVHKYWKILSIKDIL